MNAVEKGEIYDRLLKMKLETEFEKIPNPDYINKKLGLCHIFIEEIEGYSIKAYKVTSIVQRSLNDSLSNYEVMKQEMISSNSDIINLPNIKDREARADSYLKDNLKTIRDLKNELLDLKNLIKVIELKNKNLNRVNNDIKMQLRLMESEIKLNFSLKDDTVTRGLLTEMSKGISGKDSFSGAKTEESIEKVFNEESIDKELINPEPSLSQDIRKELEQPSGSTPDPQNNKEESVDVKPEETSSIPKKETEPVKDQEPSEISEPTEDIDTLNPSPDVLKEADLLLEEQQKNSQINLDQLTQEEKKDKSPPKNGIDIESLMKNLT